MSDYFEELEKIKAVFDESELKARIDMLELLSSSYRLPPLTGKMAQTFIRQVFTLGWEGGLKEGQKKV